MLNVSMLAVPVLLDTAGEASQLVDQWARVYYYGFRLHPAIAITTCLLYAHAVFSKRAAGRQWRVFAVAGATTISMVLVTLIFMLPTNNALFRVQSECKAGRGASWGEVQSLLTTWNGLHITRSLFPMMGAVLGLLGTCQILVF